MNNMKAFVSVVLINVLLLSPVYASPDMEVARNALIEPVTWLVHFLEGTGGLFAAMLGLVVGLYAAVVNHSLWQVACSMVFEMVLHYTPAILSIIFAIPIE